MEPFLIIGRKRPKYHQVGRYKICRNKANHFLPVAAVHGKDLPPGRSVIFPLQRAEVVIEAALLIKPFPLFPGFPVPTEEGKKIGRFRDFRCGDP